MPKDIYTIVYYTSNHEDPEFEKKIQANILKQKGDIPLISVSQKPMDFGQNICVGDVGLNGPNGFRQTLIGVKAAKTPYIIFAESDFLYPPDYFTFIPPDENDCYRHDNVWIVFKDPKFGSYHKKRVSEGAQICGRELLIEKYENFFEGLPEWCDERRPPRKPEPLSGHKWKWFSGDPCISFKTGNGLRSTTNTVKEIPHERILPYWGHIKDIRRTYL